MTQQKRAQKWGEKDSKTERIAWPEQGQIGQRTKSHKATTPIQPSTTNGKMTKALDPWMVNTQTRMMDFKVKGGTDQRAGQVKGRWLLIIRADNEPPTAPHTHTHTHQPKHMDKDLARWVQLMKGKTHSGQCEKTRPVELMTDGWSTMMTWWWTSRGRPRKLTDKKAETNDWWEAGEIKFPHKRRKARFGKNTQIESESRWA